MRFVLIKTFILFPDLLILFFSLSHSYFFHSFLFVSSTALFYSCLSSYILFVSVQLLLVSTHLFFSFHNLFSCLFHSISSPTHFLTFSLCFSLTLFYSRLHHWFISLPISSIVSFTSFLIYASPSLLYSFLSYSHFIMSSILTFTYSSHILSIFSLSVKLGLLPTPT